MRHKSLHESAAEILAASVAAAGKEPVPMAAMMDPNADLGGESMMGDPTSPGAATAQSMNASPKPGRPGAPAENMKALPAEGEEESEEEEKEESPEAMNEELVVLNEEQMLLFEQAIDAEFDVLVESIVTEFREQEFTEEEFKALQEQSSQFIAEMETLTEEEFEQYLATLTEEEFVHVIQLASLDEGFFRSLGKALKKGVKSVAKVVSKVAPIASFIPGVGTALGAIGGKIAGKLAGTALGKLAGGAAGLVSKVGGAISKIPVVGGALKTAAGEALKGGVGSVLAGGKFKEGAKAAGLGSIVGSAAGAVGDAVSRATGSQVAGDVASNLAGSRLGGGGGTNYNERPERPDDVEPSQQNDQEERTQTSAAAPTQQPKEEDDNGEITSKRQFMRGVKREQQRYAMREDVQEIVGYLSALNEEQLDQFISQLSDEEAEFVADILQEGSATVPAGNRSLVPATNAARTTTNAARSGARAARLSAAEKAAALTGEIVSTGSKASRILSGAKNLARVGGRYVAPVSAAMGVVDAYQGYNVDPTATTGEKLQNAGRSFISGATLGLLGRSPEEIAADKATKDMLKRDAENRELRARGAAMGDTSALGDPRTRTKPLKPPSAKRDKENAALKAQAAAMGKDASGDPRKDVPKVAAAAVSTAGMSDEQKYGKTGAEIIKLGGMDAYKNRPKDKEGNLKYLEKLRKGGAAAATTAATTTATPATAAPVTQPAATQPATTPAQTPGEEDWSKQATWDKWTLGQDSPAPSVSNNTQTGGNTPTPTANNTEQEPKAEKEKTVGDQFVDQIKRTGRSAIRAGIGGAILGQDWQDAAKAGAVGNLVGDFADGFKQARKQNMKEQFEDSNMNGEETTMETNELTEEQIREERMLAIKEAVKQFKGNMREDVDALFNGESLSEEFRAKATLIFESAVTSRVETILEQIVQQNDEVLANAYDEIKNDLTEQVDEYLNYVVEQWMEQNQVAIETGLRAELAEDFISGLRALFQEHYIEIPEEKVDVAETLAAELETAAEYVDSVHQHVADQNETISALQEELNAVKKEKAINNFCEGLTAVQAGKMKSLAEGVEFTTEGDFEEKLAVLRENYFPTKVQVKSEVKELQKVALNEEPEVASTNNIMNRYVQAIAKTAPKA